LRKLIIQVRAIGDAYDRKEAEARGEAMEKYLQSLKAKKAKKPKGDDPNAFPPGEEEDRLRAWYGLTPREGAQKPKAEREQTPAEKQPMKPKAKKT
jgi:hypothetical protein